MLPVKENYPPFLENYISLVKEADVMLAIKTNTSALETLLRTIPNDKGDHAYAPGKWTIKQLLIHISDAERIFSYRALRFARGDDQQPLPFEEDEYAANSNADKRTLESVIDEILAVRKATTLLFESFTNDSLHKTGNTAAGKVTVNALGYTICGHTKHHINILNERYLQPIKK